MNNSAYEAIRFKLSKCLGEHLLRNVRDRALEFIEATCSTSQAIEGRSASICRRSPLEFSEPDTSRRRPDQTELRFHFFYSWLPFGDYYHYRNKVPTITL